jgi:hypothetical protein
MSCCTDLICKLAHIWGLIGAFAVRFFWRPSGSFLVHVWRLSARQAANRPAWQKQARAHSIASKLGVYVYAQNWLPIQPPNQATWDTEHAFFAFQILRNGAGRVPSTRTTPCIVNYPSIRWYWTLWGHVPEIYWFDFPHCSFTWQRVFPRLNHIHIISESGRTKSGTSRWLSISLREKPEKDALIWPQNWSLCFHSLVSSWKRSAEIHFH